MQADSYRTPELAALYDVINTWGPSDDFYLSLIMDARSVLDVGCGTALQLRRARELGHPGRLVGVDPAAAMIAQVPEGTNLELIVGTVDDLELHGQYDLVFMASHAFQELLDDVAVHDTLLGVRAALSRDGIFAFETRNPLALEAVDSHLAAASLRVVERYGDWDRSPFTPASREIITVATHG